MTLILQRTDVRTTDPPHDCGVDIFNHPTEDATPEQPEQPPTAESHPGRSSRVRAVLGNLAGKLFNKGREPLPAMAAMRRILAGSAATGVLLAFPIEQLADTLPDRPATSSSTASAKNYIGATLEQLLPPSPNKVVITNYDHSDDTVINEANATINTTKERVVVTFGSNETVELTAPSAPRR